MLIKNFTVENPFKEGTTTEVTTYWNLTKAEISDYMAGDRSVLENLYLSLESGEGTRIYKAIMEIMDLAYGVPSPDGLGLLKTPEIREAYRTGPVRDALIEWIVEDPDGASASIVKVLPKDVREEAMKGIANGAE